MSECSQSAPLSRLLQLSSVIRCSVTVMSSSARLLDSDVAVAESKEALVDSTEPHPLRPSYNAMFKPRVVETLMQRLLEEMLAQRQYDPNETSTWSKEIASAIKCELKSLSLSRYKFLVQVVIGEMKGAGAHSGCRCLWDATTDGMAQAKMQNESLFCIAVAFAVYLY